jgi:hypothetical protein
MDTLITYLNQKQQNSGSSVILIYFETFRTTSLPNSKKLPVKMPIYSKWYLIIFEILQACLAEQNIWKHL